MGITRRMANTEATRALALDKAFLKLSISAPGDIVLSAQTQSRLLAARIALNTNLALRGQALGNQMLMTPDKNAKRRIAGLYVSHFIMGCDKAALRGEPGFAQSDRTFFQLDGSNDALPPLETDDEVYLWGQRLIDGNVLRLAAGKPVMPFPLIADVITKYNLFATAFGDYNLLKRAYDDAQEAISNMREDVDSLILRIWNEVEAAYSEESPSSKRRNSREWGVVYVLTAGEAPSPDEFSIVGKVTDSVTGAELGEVGLQLMPPDSITLSESNGNFYIPVLPPATYSINVHRAGYADKVVSNIVVTAGAITTVNIQLAPVGTVSGTVTTADTATAATITVDGVPGLSVTTDPMGNYTLHDVTAGAQVIRATLVSNPATFLTHPATVPSGGTVGVNFSF